LTAAFSSSNTNEPFGASNGLMSPQLKVVCKAANSVTLSIARGANSEAANKNRDYAIDLYDRRCVLAVPLAQQACAQAASAGSAVETACSAFLANPTGLDGMTRPALAGAAGGSRFDR
jgi:hypothetical protein